MSNKLDNITDEERHEIIVRMKYEVMHLMDKPEMKRAIEAVVEKVLSEDDIDHKDMLRRDHDGVSQADWLVRKMIGEYLAEGAPHI